MGFGGLGFALLLFNGPSLLVGIDPLAVFAACEFAGLVLLAVTMYFLDPAVGVWLRRRRILRQPLVERFETPPEVAVWIEKANSIDESCDLFAAGSCEVFVADGTIATIDDRPWWVQRHKVSVWVGELPPELYEAGFRMGG